MFISVLLPEPLVPDDGDELAALDRQIHAPARAPCPRRTVVLGDPIEDHDVVGRGGAAHGLGSFGGAPPHQGRLPLKRHHGRNSSVENRRSR